MPSETNRNYFISLQDNSSIKVRCRCDIFNALGEKKKHVTSHAYLPYPPFDDRLGSEHPLPDGRQLHVYSSAIYR